MNKSFIRAVTGKLPAVLLYANSTASLLIGIAAQSIGFVILARSLGTEQYGYLATITAVTSLALPWCGVGAVEAMRRRVGRDHSFYPAVLAHWLALWLVSGVVLTAFLTVALAANIHVAADPGENRLIVFLLVLGNVMPAAWIAMAENIFLAHNAFARANVVNSGAGVARAATAVIACLAYGVNSLQSWAWWNAAVNVCVSGACIVAVAPYGAPRGGILREELPLGASLSVSSFFLILRHNIDLLIIGVTLPATVVGAYAVAKRIVAACFVISGSFDRLIYTRLVLAGNGGARVTLNLARKYLVYTVGLGGVASIGLYVIAPLLPFLFGKDFGEATSILRILCWILILFGIQNLAYDALAAIEHHRARMVVGFGITFLGAGSVVLLTRAYGINGTYAAVYAWDFAMACSLWLTLIYLGSRQDRGGTPAQSTGDSVPSAPKG